MHSQSESEVHHNPRSIKMKENEEAIAIVVRMRESNWKTRRPRRRIPRRVTETAVADEGQLKLAMLETDELMRKMDAIDEKVVEYER